jgi:GNAT superfamily N-acetyltransferase
MPLSAASPRDAIVIESRVVAPDTTRSDFDLVPATEIPEAALAKFYERMYPERAAFLTQHWRWLYRLGHCEAARGPLVALDGPTVIGHIGSIPMELRAGADTRAAEWDVDLAVLPAYQGRKVATQLMQAHRAQGSLHVAFGNEKSTGTVTKIGWQLSHATRSFQLLLRPELHPKLQGTALSGIGRLGGWLTRCVWAARAPQVPRVIDLTTTPVSAAALTPFAQAPSDGALHVARTPEFLRWRVLAHPSAQEHCVLRCGHSGYAALARLSEQQGFRRLHLLSLAAEPFDADTLARFFAGVVRWSLDQQIHRILFVTSRTAIAQVAQRWFPVTSALRFLSYASDAVGWRYLSAPPHWECLDSDFDLTV